MRATPHDPTSELQEHPMEYTADSAPTTRHLDSGHGGAAATAHAPATADAWTERSRRIWSAGDYDRIAAGFRDAGAAFVARQSLRPGQRVLDAACGSGNLTIPAARTAAAVTGLDLVPALLDVAAAWAAREGLAVTLDEGSVEALPYADGAFDLVLSMFGVMFAARPDQVAGELARVTRPGGRVALANWTRAGFIGQMFAMHAAAVAPPAGVPSPLLWGDELAIRALLDERTWDVTTTVRTLDLRYPHAPAETAALFCATYGPTVRTLEALDPTRRASFVADLAEHWTRYQRGDQTTVVKAEYLETVAVRR
jgi:2-polyprenyl-3-methyl-5-hydroxy-6-metoxy-1,4-benzoquinol methylase